MTAAIFGILLVNISFALDFFKISDMSFRFSFHLSSISAFYFLLSQLLLRVLAFEGRYEAELPGSRADIH